MMMAATLLSFLLPLAGAVVLAFSGGRLGPRASTAIGVGSVGLAALATGWALLALDLVITGEPLVTCCEVATWI